MTDDQEPISSPQEEEDDVFDEEEDSEENRFLGEKTKSTLLHVLESGAGKAKEDSLPSIIETPASPRPPSSSEETKTESSATEKICSPREQAVKEAAPVSSPITSPRNDAPSAESSLRVRLRKAHGNRPRRDVVSINLEAMSALAVADIKRFSLSSTAVLEVEVAKAKGLHPVKAGPPSAMCLLAIRKDTSKDHEKKIDTKKPHEATSVVPKNSAPFWNEKKELKLDQVKGESQRYLVVEVRDKGVKGDFLGFVEINLNNIADIIQREEWFELQKKKKRDKVTGEILLRTCIRPERKVEETIVMRGESFPTIPSFIYNSFWNQHCVRQLSVTHCDIGSIPEGISALSSLETLQVSNNNIATVPKTLARIFTLTFLDISHNRVATLPQELSHMKNLQVLHLGDNKWSDEEVPPPVVDLDLWCDIHGKPPSWDSLIEAELRKRESEGGKDTVDDAAQEKEKEIQRLLESMGNK